MKRSARRFLGGILVSLAAAALAVGCGGGSGTSGGGGTAGGGGTPSSSSGGSQGSVVLTVDMATAPNNIGVHAPAQGRFFVEVDITLQDVSTPSPIPVAFTFFTLSTANGLVLQPSIASAAVGTPCPGDISIAAGSQFTCSIAYEVPLQDSPKDLSYDDHAGHTATASVTVTPPPPPDPCETVVKWQQEQSTACKDCEKTLCKTERDEWLAEMADGQTCPNQAACTMANCTTQNQCPCLGACLGACKPAWQTYLNCAIAKCSDKCM
ncbi:MAG: hypothetical protein QM820_20070 [Minicystis sp.]